MDNDLTTSPAPSQPPAAWSLPGRLAGVAREELGGFSVRFWLAGLLMRPLPEGMAGRLRATVYRICGLAVGPQTLFAGPLTLAAPKATRAHLRIGIHCFVNRLVFIDAAAPVTIGDNVSIGHHVVIITTDHLLGKPNFRAGTVQVAPVVIEDGAWVAAGVTILPGVTVGAGAVVAAGAVVTKDVPPHTLAGGVPAKVIRNLSSEN